MRLQDGNQYPGKRVIISLRFTNFSKTCIDLLCYNPSQSAALLTVCVARIPVDFCTRIQFLMKVITHRSFYPFEA